MNLADSEGDTTCSSFTQVGQEVLAGTGQDLIVYSYPATNGVPFLLDATRKFTGTIVLRGTITERAYAELSLAGNVGGTDMTIAEGETTAGSGRLSDNAQGVDLPGPPAILTFEIGIAPDLDFKVVTDLDLNVTVRGLHRGGIDHERTPSFIVVPGLIFQLAD